jgi:hypothetical protein
MANKDAKDTRDFFLNIAIISVAVLTPTVSAWFALHWITSPKQGAEIRQSGATQVKVVPTPTVETPEPATKAKIKTQLIQTIKSK